ncbi:hypothetical protein VTK26DRAFT_2827 [Humicola hyalothermophila]
MTSSANTPTSRKRTRLQNEQHPPSTASKKRRLKPSSDATPASAAASAPQTKNSQSDNTGASRSRRRVATAETAKDGAATTSWEVPDSEKERLKPEKATPQRQPKSSVYDFPDSDEDELATPVVTPRPLRQKSSVSGAAGDDADSAPSAVTGESRKRKRGRPSKRDRESQAEAQDRSISDIQLPPSTGSTQRVRRSAARGIAAREPGQARNGEPQDQGAANASSVSKARQSRATANARVEEDVQMPKGILTPRKGRSGGDHQRKSAAFDGKKADQEALDELAAETPSKSHRKGREKPSYSAAVPMELNGEQKTDKKTPGDESGDDDNDDDDDDDDEVCAICSKPDSEPPNEIVFCDNCDMAVHQECYGIAEIPEGDWICRDCSQEGVTLADGGAISGPQPSAGTLNIREPDIPNFDHHLRSMQRVLLDRCAGRRRIKLCGQVEAYNKARQLVEQTIVAGEGNSMMIIGARGCGKTTLVESIVSDMSKEHSDQFHAVRLNGFIHTDDKLALKEIWRQLGKEMEVEDELVNKTSNYADTMASLLALLSHPSEITETQEGMTSRSIIFIIDEFDLFATHARQTLLYNLFDIAQARKAPIAVLGLTTRIDVVESLEKRVKSRFSHRYVYLSLPPNVPAFWDICRQGLTVDDEDMVAEGIDPEMEGHSEYWDWWNGLIETLSKTRGFMDHLESHFYSSKSVPAFLTTCILPIAALSPAAPSLQIPAVSEGLAAVSLEPPDSKLHLLGSLSDLDLSMLISAARLDIVAHTDTVNFAMAYDEYTSLMGRQRVQSASSGMLALGGGARVWGRGTAGIAWERLVALGLLVPAAAGGRGTAGLGGLDAKMWKVDVALEEIPAAVKLNAVLARWCKEI